MAKNFWDNYGKGLPASDEVQEFDMLWYLFVDEDDGWKLQPDSVLRQTEEYQVRVSPFKGGLNFHNRNAKP